MVIEKMSSKDKYEGHTPLELKVDFWNLCHMLPSPVTGDSVQQAVDYYNGLIDKLAAGESLDNQAPLDNPLEHRSMAKSKVRRLLTQEVLVWSTHIPITTTYGRFIAERRFGSHFHWGVDSSQFLNPKAFPAYLVGLEGDQENLGICDSVIALEIERSDYHEVVTNHASEWRKAVEFFGQAAMDRLMESVAKGEVKGHSTTILLHSWRNDFIERYGMEP